MLTDTALTLPTTEQEVWRYSRIGELALDRYEDVPSLYRKAKVTVEADDCTGKPIADSGGKSGGVVITRDTRAAFSINEGDTTTTTTAAAATSGSR